MTKCEIIDKKKDKDIIFLHGFLGNPTAYKRFKKHYDDLEYNLIYCNSYDKKLKDTNIEDLCDWNKSLSHINDLINKRKNETVLIGNSMGGSIFLTLSNNNNYVNKVFAISAPYKLDNVKEINKRIKICNDINGITSTLPYNIKDDIKNKDRFFIHEINDNVVNIDNFHENKNKFNVPNENTLVLNYVFPFFTHIRTTYNKKTHNFIKDNILLSNNGE